MKILAPDDDNEYQNVAHDTTNEEYEIENCDNDQKNLVFHLLRPKDCLKTVENICITKLGGV